jgi:hypothetical protein
MSSSGGWPGRSTDCLEEAASDGDVTEGLDGLSANGLLLLALLRLWLHASTLLVRFI